MKQWWFRYAISQLIKKLIILQLLFIHFNYAINQLMNQLLNTAPSQFHLHVLHGGIAPAMSCAGRFVIYLFGMGAV